jgi:hypothetical protein
MYIHKPAFYEYTIPIRKREFFQNLHSRSSGFHRFFLPFFRLTAAARSMGFCFLLEDCSGALKGSAFFPPRKTRVLFSNILQHPAEKCKPGQYEKYEGHFTFPLDKSAEW